MTIIFTQTKAFWDNVIISDRAVLQETSNSNGKVVKKFNAKAGSGNMDHVAFFVEMKDELNVKQLCGRRSSLSHVDLIVRTREVPGPRFKASPQLIARQTTSLLMMMLSQTHQTTRTQEMMTAKQILTRLTALATLTTLKALTTI